MNHIRSVFIGNFSLHGKAVYSLGSYAQFYNELAGDPNTGGMAVFAGYFLPGDPGFEFSFEQPLSGKINFTLSRGNSSTTRLLPFLWNNILLLGRLTLFCLKKGAYFVFLPSPIGVWSILLVTLFRKKKSLGIYIGGYYGREQSFEQRKGSIKKRIKKWAALLVDRLVVYAIKKSDYVITSSYEYHHQYGATGKVFLTPPMLNVAEGDLELSVAKRPEVFITYCGELRHAKGVVDLVKAFAQVVRTEGVPACKLKIIGSGQAYEELVQLSEGLGIGALVVFCGQIKNKQKLKEELGSSALFVLPSYSEGFPRVAYECFTLGVASILTPVGGIPFFVNDKEHCLFAQPGNVNDLADKISTLLRNEHLRSRLACNARQLMAQTVFPRIKAEGSLARMTLNKMAALRKT